jgi:peptidoglycan/LPS O-acetylase OafA/YrhL
VDLLSGLFNSRRKRGGSNDFFDTLRGASRWIVSCGCALALAIIFLVILLVGGAIQLGDDALTVGVVIAMIIVAVVSLIRTARS